MEEFALSACFLWTVWLVMLRSKKIQMAVCTEDLHLSQWFSGRWYEIAASNNLTRRFSNLKNNSLQFVRLPDGSMDLSANGNAASFWLNGSPKRAEGFSLVEGMNLISWTFVWIGTYSVSINIRIMHVSEDRRWCIMSPLYDTITPVYILSKHRVMKSKDLALALKNIKSLGLDIKTLKASDQKKQIPDPFLLDTFRRFGIRSSKSCNMGGGISPFIFDDDGVDPSESLNIFWFGCMQGDVSFLYEFIEREILWLDQRDDQLWTCFHYASFNGRLYFCEFLLLHKVVMSSRTVLYETPLRMAILGYVRHLKELGSSVEPHSKWSLKPHSLTQYEKVLCLLLSNGASLRRLSTDSIEAPIDVLNDKLNSIEISSSPEILKSISIVRSILNKGENGRNTHNFRSFYIRMSATVLKQILEAVKLLLRFASRLLHSILFFGWFVITFFVYWISFRFVGFIVFRIVYCLDEQQRIQKTSEFCADLAVLWVLAIDNPTVDKVAQLISCRPDLVDIAISNKFIFLRDNAPIMEPSQVQEAITFAYGADYSRVFKWIDLQPFASGTIGQVHRAELVDGTYVAVKLVRPSVRVELEKGLTLLHGLLSLLKHSYRANLLLTRLRYVSVMIICQTDMLLEAASMASFAANTESCDDWTQCPLIPRPYSTISTNNVLVMEMMMEENHVPFLLFQKVQIPATILALRLGHYHLRCVLLNGLFHCDLHPGNIYFHKMSGKFTLLDFGMVAELKEFDRVNLNIFFLAVHSKNSELAFEVFSSHFVEYVGGIFKRNDINEFKFRMQGLFLDHFGGDWDANAWITDCESVLMRYGYISTSVWANVELSLLTLQGTLQELDPSHSFSKLFEQFLSSHYKSILDTITSNSASQRDLLQNFGWGALLDSHGTF